MRRLPKNIHYRPMVFGLRLRNFFYFGFLAAMERFFIDSDLHAFLVVIGSYLMFFLFEKLIPKNFFFYLLTRVHYFENPYQ